MNPFWWENTRKKLVDRGFYRLAKLTYQLQKSYFIDRNTSSFWDNKFLNLENDTSFIEKWRFQRIVGELRDVKTLNIGVGSGKLEKKLFEIVNQKKYFATDITNKALKKLQDLYPDANWYKSSPLNLPFEENSFEQVLLIEVIEHFKVCDTFSVLSEIFSVLKGDGTLIISIPVNEHLEREFPRNPNSHMRIYSEELIKYELIIAGFSVEKIYRASAFSSFFKVKHLINKFLWLREPNNLILVCKKPST